MKCRLPFALLIIFIALEQEQLLVDFTGVFKRSKTGNAEQFRTGVQIKGDWQ